MSAPLLRVVKGEPTAEELAALAVVVAALSQSGRRHPRPTPVFTWAAPARLHRRAPVTGAGGWQASGRPA